MLEFFIIPYIDKQFKKLEALDNEIHSKLLSLYDDYLYVGGMPSSVIEYIECDREVINIKLLNSHQIITDYTNDKTKYTTSKESLFIKEIYSNVPSQIRKSPKQFIMKEIFPRYNNIGLKNLQIGVEQA